jgi:diguanylate cyclase (GGDEF)-like protein
MAEGDGEASRVVSKALDELTDRPGEMLLAYSSRAHLRQVAAAASGSPGCGVTTPWGCPAVRRSRTLAFEDSTRLEACPRLCDRCGDPISAACVPVTILGTPMGVIHVTGEAKSPPPKEEIGDLEALAEQAGSRIGVIRAMASSQLQATTDPLTGLLNRRSLEAELDGIREVGGEFAVVFLDLDHFKDLNDTFGHDTGDRVLRSFAAALRRCSREGDTVARYGGEEFVVLLPEASMSAAVGFYERLKADLESASERGDLPAHTASGGLADSSLTEEVREVVRLADLAMYRAKQEGRNTVRFASDDMATGDAGDPAPALGFPGGSQDA